MRYRLSAPAAADIAAILRTSETMHGASARTRYRGLLAAALRRIARDPMGNASLDRGEFGPGLRSLHVRHARDESREALVAEPVHVVFYRIADPGVVEIARVLHDRMEPSRHIDRGPRGRWGGPIR